MIYDTQSEHPLIDKLENENKRLRKLIANGGRPECMLGNSSIMRELYGTILYISQSVEPVLICGESGTGKKVVARAIHEMGFKNEATFIHINCREVKGNLLEKNLSNIITALHEQSREKLSYITVFFENVDDVSLRAQNLVCNFLLSIKSFFHGSYFNDEQGIRVLASTTSNLEIDSAKGKFNNDLYNVFRNKSIYIPPLRARGADILLLANHFLSGQAMLYQKRIDQFSIAAIEFVNSYRWPGNISEMELVIKSALKIAKGNTISAHDIITSMLRNKVSDKLSLESIIENYEKELIINALEVTKGNQNEAALCLKTTKRILQYKLEKYEIDILWFKKIRFN